MNKIQKIILLFIVVISVILRFSLLDKVPPSLHADEAAEGFNAYSLLETGKDMYGKSFPLLFRANGSYQPPVYTYLSIIPTAIWGNSMFTIRFLSALSGVITVLLTFWLVAYFSEKKRNYYLGLMVAGVVSISPWAIHFSRLAAEANLAIAFFALGIIFLVKSLKNIRLFPLATFVLGFTTQVYYTERVVVVLLLGLVLIIYHKYFLRNWRGTLWGLGIFVLTMIPHIYLVATGALTKRLDQVSYLGEIFQSSLSIFQKVWLGIGQFINHYLRYFSSKNLFFDPGTKLGITTTDIGVFYPWMIIPFLAGIKYLFKNRKSNLVRIILLIIFLGPIPAGLTGDIFYPLRTLDFLWVLTIVISFGLYDLVKLIKNNFTKTIVLMGIIIYSLAAFGISYFVLFKYEEAASAGEPYIRLIPKLFEYPDKKIIVDYSSRAWGVGIRAVYLAKANPEAVQKQLSSQLVTPYYSGVVNAQEVFTIDNISFEPLNWNKVCGKDILFIGDLWSFSPTTIEEHGLKLEFDIQNYLNEPVLFGYSSTVSCK